MLAVQTVPLLLSILIGSLLSLVAWGTWRSRVHQAGIAPMRTDDGMLLGLLVLAIIALSVFVSYAVLR